MVIFARIRCVYYICLRVGTSISLVMDNIYVRISVKYGLSRAGMSQVLGLGVNQWRLFEEGAMPQRSHRLLVSVAQDPRGFRRLLVNSNGAVVGAIGLRDYRRLLAMTDKMVLEFES